MMHTPYDLNNARDYARWREHKLTDYPRAAADIQVDIEHPNLLSETERQQAKLKIAKANMTLLRCTNTVHIYKVYLTRLGNQLGLSHLDENLCADEDGISTLRVSDKQRPHDYIPYTERPLNWHTDGYYNAPGAQIRAWSLVCEQDAAEGGENALLDPEILYILLRDENPGYIRALMDPSVLCIPANIENGTLIRPQRRGPVFSVHPRDGSLHMRYSARSRNIRWRQDSATLGALEFIRALFSSDSPYIFRHRLRPGECLLSNNVLHNRGVFRDTPEQKRVIYRARYFDRVQVAAPTRLRD